MSNLIKDKLEVGDGEGWLSLNWWKTTAILFVIIGALWILFG